MASGKFDYNAKLSLCWMRASAVATVQVVRGAMSLACQAMRGTASDE